MKFFASYQSWKWIFSVRQLFIHEGSQLSFNWFSSWNNVSIFSTKSHRSTVSFWKPLAKKIVRKSNWEILLLFRYLYFFVLQKHLNAAVSKYQRDCSWISSFALNFYQLSIFHIRNCCENFCLNLRYILLRSLKTIRIRTLVTGTTKNSHIHVSQQTN